MSPRSPRLSTSFREKSKSPHRSPHRSPASIILARQDSIGLSKNRITKKKHVVPSKYRVRLHDRNRNTRRMVSENFDKPLHELGVYVSDKPTSNDEYIVMQPRYAANYRGGKNKSKKNRRTSKR